MVDKKLGHYEILGPLGAGGMGEVYRARDTRLDRDVAIKVLPADFATDSQRLARFEREAKLLASLNHANIAAIYGLETEGDRRFIAMELVDGETLADRIARSGRIDLEEALEIARQIADALEAAHESGVIHRDLKPANVIVTNDGKVKVLDFGLAKASISAGGDTDESLTHSPTTTIGVTEAGVLLGTAPYMSPEQARGKVVDKRTDIWAFGCVLFEMLAGSRAFGGETVSDTLAAVIRAEPEWRKLPASTPAAIRRLLRRCMSRDPKLRIHHAGDARLECLDAVREEEAAPASPAAKTLMWRRSAIGLAVLVLAVVLGAFFAPWRDTPAPLMMLDLSPPDGRPVVLADGPTTLSPDGTMLTIVLGPLDDQVLAVRSLDDAEYRILDLAGISMFDPFWSPDGRSLGFFGGDARLKRIDVGGGSAVDLAPISDARGGDWSSDDVIIFAPAANGPLYRINADGSDPVAITTLDAGRGETGHWRPRFLPGGQRFLYLAITEAMPTVQAPRLIYPEPPEVGMSLWVGSLDGAAPIAVDGSFTSAVAYSPTGHLLYVRDRTLIARAFDADRLIWAAEPVVLVEAVGATLEFGTPAFSVSSNGILSYHEAGPPPERRLVIRDRSGGQVSAFVSPGDPQNLDLAADGVRLAVERTDESGNVDIWIVDLVRRTHQRLTFDATHDNGPVFSPGGDRVAYVRREPGRYRLLSKAASGVGSETVLFEAPEGFEAVDWSPDGQLMLIEGIGVAGDLWLVPTAGPTDRGEDVNPTLFAGSPYAEHSARFSPDGNLIAYASSDSGRNEIFVQPWPPGGGRWQVSTEGGVAPRWRDDGTEIFYRDNGGRLMAFPVEMSVDGTLASAIPQPLFDMPTPQYEPLPGGQQFVIVESTEDIAAARATIVVNWPRLLEIDARTP